MYGKETQMITEADMAYYSALPDERLYEAYPVCERCGLRIMLHRVRKGLIVGSPVHSCSDKCKWAINKKRQRKALVNQAKTYKPDMSAFEDAIDDEVEVAMGRLEDFIADHLNDRMLPPGETIGKLVVKAAPKGKAPDA